jgi:hypothetical protein
MSKHKPNSLINKLNEKEIIKKFGGRDMGESIVPEKRNDLLNLVQDILFKLDNVLRDVRTEQKKAKRKNKVNKKQFVKNLMKHKDSQLDLSIKPEKNYSKKKMQTKQEVFFNDKKWNIVTSMVTGIYKSIGLVNFSSKLPPTQADFGICNRIEIEAVLERKFAKCKFKDYAPYVFSTLRHTFGVSDEDYVESIGYHTFKKAFLNRLSLMLQENSSGKSGSFFFHTADMKYMIKTIKKAEFTALLKMLPDYFKYMIDNPDTYLTKYYGLHQLKCFSKSGRIVYTIYVGNIYIILLIKKSCHE